MAECVGCGYCCIKTPCAVSIRLYPGAKKCPQLEWTNDRYTCGLMTLPEPLGADYRKELYANEGCCCALNSWRKDVKKREPELKRTSVNPLPEIMQIFIACLAQEFMSNDKMYLIVERMKSNLTEKDYAEDEITSIAKSCIHAFKENQNSFMKNFMG